MKGNRIAGLILIAFGGLYLTLKILDLNNILTFYFWDLWPFTIIAIGAFFEIIYFSNKRYHGVLIPGGILTTIGLLHLFEVITSWEFSSYTWPIYTLAIFIGFFQVYLVKKEKWALTLSLIFFFIFLFLSSLVVIYTIGLEISFSIMFSILVIVIGFILLFTSKPSKS